jgi:hypothetical protein
MKEGASKMRDGKKEKHAQKEDVNIQSLMVRGAFLQLITWSFIGLAAMFGLKASKNNSNFENCEHDPKRARGFYLKALGLIVIACFVTYLETANGI